MTQHGLFFLNRSHTQTHKPVTKGFLYFLHFLLSRSKVRTSGLWNVMLYVSDCSRGASVYDVKIIPGSGFIKWMRPLWFYKAEKQGQVQESTIEIWPGELMVLLEEKVSIKVGQQMEAPTCPGGCCVQFGSNTADQRPPTAANDLDPRPSQTAGTPLWFSDIQCVFSQTAGARFPYEKQYLLLSDIVQSASPHEGFDIRTVTAEAAFLKTSAGGGSLMQ